MYCNEWNIVKESLKDLVDNQDRHLWSLPILQRLKRIVFSSIINLGVMTMLDSYITKLAMANALKELQLQ